MPHYVLHDFAKADQDWLEPLIDAIADNAALLAEGKDATFANRLHAATQPPTPEKKAKGGEGLGRASGIEVQSHPRHRVTRRSRPKARSPAALKKLFGG